MGGPRAVWRQVWHRSRYIKGRWRHDIPVLKFGRSATSPRRSRQLTRSYSVETWTIPARPNSTRSSLTNSLVWLDFHHGIAIVNDPKRLSILYSVFGSEN